MSNTAFVGSTLDSSVLDLARMENPVSKEQDGGDAKSQNDQNGHSKSGVENFNVCHSEEKDSKKLFSSYVKICKLYLNP